MRILPLLVAAAMAIPAAAQATCPATLPIVDQLSCSSTLASFVDHTDTSNLGGECDTGDCYTCGEPWVNRE